MLQQHVWSRDSRRHLLSGHPPQVPVADNYYAALNSAVFSDGSFVFIPKGVKSPMEISTYFRINASETGQVRARPWPWPHWTPHSLEFARQP